MPFPYLLQVMSALGARLAKVEQELDVMEQTSIDAGIAHESTITSLSDDIKHLSENMNILHKQLRELESLLVFSVPMHNAHNEQPEPLKVERNIRTPSPERRMQEGIRASSPE
jgi:hypothetical protein